MATEHKDFLDVVLDFEGSGKDEPAKLSHLQISIFLMEMFMAGTETTSSTTEWAMSELLQNPESMNKIKAELRRVVGVNNKLTESHIDNLPYLQATIEETLRLHAPVPLVLPRKAIQDTDFMGYKIPKDGKRSEADIVNEIDVGKEITRNNSLDDPGKHSRLWVQKDICYVLHEDKGTEAIEELVILELPHSKMTTMWEVNMVSNAFRKPPLLALILNKPLFQIYSGFEQNIVIYFGKVEEFPDWITQSSVQGSAVYRRIRLQTEKISSSVNLQPNLSQNYLGLILFFQSWQLYHELDYSVMTSASNVFRSNDYTSDTIVIVPRSIFTVTDADHTIKFTSNANKQWIHLLYKNEDDNTTVNVEDERNTLSASDLEVEDGPDSCLSHLACKKFS
ncbi:hypothetical protein POM88_019759 [Heracleum sosnowskyi]|uniref:Cytochrome P450 n=1 Tax=Heracleum sosnowskyi TaxID=360622 RepID=A0AAD8MRF2_9APIA|nr:hypothetical protein POM88_019759 [Heracleum sosnowskyi]